MCQIDFFLPLAADILSTRAVIPENADVANAVGAITSRIKIRRKFDIISPQSDRYRVVRLVGVRNFSDLDEASTYAETSLSYRRCQSAGGLTRPRFQPGGMIRFSILENKI